jgi:hypothetical protein
VQHKNVNEQQGVTSMRSFTRFALLLSLAALWSCASQTATVVVPPRVDLQGYRALGLVDFASNTNPSINAQTTREFESRVRAAQPGARIVDLGSRESLLASVDSREFDGQALRKIGQKYGVDAIFVGTLSYSEPKTEVKITDDAKAAGNVQVELRADISFELMETRTGTSLWSSSVSARRPIGRTSVSAEAGVSGALRDPSNPREAMVPSLVYDLTDDFRSNSMARR